MAKIIKGEQNGILIVVGHDLVALMNLNLNTNGIARHYKKERVNDPMRRLPHTVSQSRRKKYARLNVRDKGNKEIFDSRPIRVSYGMQA